MEAGLVLMITGFLLSVSGIWFFLNADHSAFKEVLLKITHIEMARLESEKVNKQLHENASNTFDQIYSEVSNLQDHCARVKDQQALLAKKQMMISEQLANKKVDVNVVYSSGAKTSKRASH